MTRLLDVIQTRRGTLRDALAGLLALAVMFSPEPVVARNKKKKKKHKKKKKQCPGGLTLCVGVCVDLNNDPNNCGRCERECDDGETCRNGVCGCDVCEGGDCPFVTVQAAIDARLPGSTITICDGKYTGNIVIDKDITLLGNEDVILEGEGGNTGGSVLTVLAGVTATVREVLITGGTGTFDDGFLRGGGVFNRGILTLITVGVAENRAERGAGIVNDGDGVLILDDSGVFSNRAHTDQPNEASFAGGILNHFGGHVTITNSSVIGDNRAGNSAGIHNNGTMQIFASEIIANISEVDGGGIINDQATLTLNNSLVRNNKASDGRGGGILNLGFELTIENGSELSGNEADTDGGGLFNEFGGQVIFTDSAIRDNEADGDGGGIYNRGGRVTLIRSPVSENEADNGAGVLNSGTAPFGQVGTLTLEGTTISDNDAQDDGGGILNIEDGLVILDAQSAVVDNDPNNCVGTAACPA